MAPATPAAPKPPAKTKKVTIPNVAFDPEYLRQIGNNTSNYNSLHAQIALQDQQYNARQAVDMQELGWNRATKTWNKTDPTTQYQQAWSDNREDYGGRGGYFSSDRAKDQTTLTRQFDQRRNASDMAQQQNHAALAAQSTTARGLLGQNNSDARALAAQRIAAKYGIGTGQVPTNPKGKRNTTVTIPVTG